MGVELANSEHPLVKANNSGAINGIHLILSRYMQLSQLSRLTGYLGLMKECVDIKKIMQTFAWNVVESR